jgi:gp16 family phage-associated protein
MSEFARPELLSRVRSRDDARAWFRATGTSVSDWAKSHGFQREHVYAVLAGRTSGNRGHAHEVAMALGIKPAVSAGLDLVALPTANKGRAAPTV